ncbi:uncharacterized protein PHACADRAFT_185756 [Phanerochaete carnosa HHB-10118-sp]|uniref:Uncharacterized protein n=1 Tax=Phanerochaete carnosa (strain HHB-10118-sp) TaxID=650164 RepID=K5USN3_PHACS|nr:uncharacterized protein PHACADRAFT_185756 [Phanerochaete carnosa HHB-10118-sp]EKM52931.1 hypothetical protein PHACADRAFT_185756 [Phanerochaete carnosa HHB-10118-sp]
MAANVPEELFEHILWHACNYGFALPLCRETKTAISLFGQVSRYWARLSRRRLFCELVLRSPDDLQRLQTFLAAPTPTGLEPIAELVLSFRAVVNGGCRPWIHLAASVIKSRLRNCQYFTLAVVQLGNRSPAEQWRTLHPSLPRTLPGSTSQIFRLHFNSMHFPNGRTLFRLLAPIPSLCAVDLIDITWDTEPTTNDFFAAPFGWRLSGVVSDSLLATYFLPLLVASIRCAHPATKGRRERLPKYLLDVEDHRTLLDLLSILEGSRSAHEWVVPSVECRRTVGRIHDSLYDDGPERTRACFLTSRCDDAQYMADLQFFCASQLSCQRLGPEVFVHLTLDDSLTVHGPAVLHIDAIHVSYMEDLPAFAGEVLNEGMWASFADTTLRLHHLPIRRASPTCSHAR